MPRVFAITKEEELLKELNKALGCSQDLQFSSYVTPLKLIENYTSMHSELVIVDLDLLGDQATHLMNVLRNIKKNVQFILILSPDKMPICSEAISLGVISYILKPCSGKNLSNLILSTLNKLKVHN